MSTVTREKNKPYSLLSREQQILTSDLDAPKNWYNMVQTGLRSVGCQEEKTKLSSSGQSNCAAIICLVINRDISWGWGIQLTLFSAPCLELICLTASLQRGQPDLALLSLCQDLLNSEVLNMKKTFDQSKKNARARHVKTIQGRTST